MKVKPVKHMPKQCPLPTVVEAAADPTLLSVAPPRAPRGIGAVLGAGLLGSLLAQMSGCAKESEKPPVATLDADHAADDAKAAECAEAARQAVATLVAPMLQKALDEDGRGAFGCEAVDPPIVLSENEALNLIEQEFAKAGIKLRDCYELTGFTRTRTDWSAPRKPKSKDQEDEWRYAESVDGDPARPKKSEPGSWVFDFATEDGSLLVEFLSLADYDALKDSKYVGGGSVSGYNLPRLAVRFREELSTRKHGKPVTIALFFDPLEESSFYIYEQETNRFVLKPGSSWAALSPEERRKLTRGQGEALKKKDALNKLLEQVRFFLEWAKKEGRIPSPQGS